LAAYLPTLAPGISWRNGGSDGAELAAAVATLGLAHPPGYPTYLLLGRAWVSLPWGSDAAWGGDVAYRLNLLSAASAALAAGLTTTTILRLGGWRLNTQHSSLIIFAGAVCGGLLLAFAPGVWQQATITEVYTPGLAFLSLMSLLLVGWWQSGPPRILGKQKDNGGIPPAPPGVFPKFGTRSWWRSGRFAGLMLAGLVGGLGMGILPQMVFAAPGVAWLLYARKAGRREWLAAMAMAGLGLTTFAYLPLRAAAQPMVSWGDATTLAGFWEMGTAAQYHPLLGALTGAEWLARVGETLLQLGQQLSWAGVGLAIWGGTTLRRSDRSLLVYFVSLILLNLLFRAGYPAANSQVYLLPCLYGLAVLAGLGIARMLAEARAQLGKVAPILLILLLLVALGWRTVGVAAGVDASADYRAILFGQRVFAELPPRALILSGRDETTFSLWYHQALGERPDLVVLDERLLGVGWYQADLVRRYPDLAPTSLRRDTLTTLGRPAYQVVGPPGEERLEPLAGEYRPPQRTQ
jgi:hypothetical protein